MAPKVEICAKCGRIKQIFDKVNGICYGCFAQYFKLKLTSKVKEEEDEADKYSDRSSGGHIDVRV